MKKALFALIVLTSVLLFSRPVQANLAEDRDEWTILLYMCGSDLESRYSCATGNLAEIAQVLEPDSAVIDTMANKAFKPAEITPAPAGKVNVLVETGGAKQWHGESLNMDIRCDALQIWRYDAGRDGAGGRYVLETEQPLVSMADADTLAAFIRWGVEHYPAKKYGLVLWGHGGGSAMGVLIDELFDGSYMTLDVLGQALHDSGTHFEAVLFDACMMASIETDVPLRRMPNG